MARCFHGTLEQISPWLTLRRFGKWQEILEQTTSLGEAPYARGIGHFVRGSALAATGRPGEAQQALEQVLASAGAASSLQISVNSGRYVLTLAAEMLAGQIAFHGGRFEESILHLETAVRMEDGLNYIEPPEWGAPVRHWLGAVLLEAGRPEEAEVVYWEDLRRNPENVWSLFGLLQSLNAQGKTGIATRVEERLKRAAARADVELTSSMF